MSSLILLSSILLKFCSAVYPGVASIDSWTVTYELIPLSFVDSIKVWDGTKLRYLRDGPDFSRGNISYLYEGVSGLSSFPFAGNQWPNQDGDIQRLDECLTATDTFAQDSGLIYTVTFKETFEIYKAQIVFGTDYPSTNTISLPHNYTYPYVYVEVNDVKTSSQVIMNNTAGGWFVDDWDSDGQPDTDWTVWETDDPIDRDAAPTTYAVSFMIGNAGLTTRPRDWAVCELFIYGRFTSQAPTLPSSPPTATPTAAPSSPATKQPTTQSPTANPTQAPTVHVTTLSPTPAPTPAPTHMTGYVGCFSDGGSPRDLSVKLADYSYASPVLCVNECKRLNYKFAGLQFGRQCFCGNSYGRYGKDATPNGCSMQCHADSSQICGNSWRNSIFIADSNHICGNMVNNAASINESFTFEISENIMYGIAGVIALLLLLNILCLCWRININCCSFSKYKSYQKVQEYEI